MKRTTLMFIAIFGLVFLTGTAIAQDGNYYTVTTWKISAPEGGSMSEFTEIMQEWYDKVVSKNEYIVSERVLRHQSGADMRDWVFITEYKSWNDIDKAGDRQNELVQEAWKTAEERGDFFSKFFSYARTHSDEIMQEVPGVRK